MKCLLASATLLLLATGLNAQVFGDFECASAGSFPGCDGWVNGPGVQTIQSATSVTVPSLPTSGSQFLEIPALGSPASPAYTVGSQSPVWPLTAGNSHVSKTLVASGDTISVDYVWASFSAAAGAGSWMQILVVDPTTQAIVTTVAVEDASTAPLMPFSHNPSFGSPLPTTTALITATATIPPAHVGQSVEVIAMASETQNIFISPNSFLYVDNFRFTTTIPNPYPGNGSDCAVEVDINGTTNPGGLHPMTVGDSFLLRMLSPGGTLDGAGMALAYTIHPTSQPQMGIAITGAGPFDVWVTPSNASLVFDSLQAGPFFLVPFLFPGGYSIGPYAVPSGLTGTSVNFQLIVNDPSKPFGFGLSDGDEMIFM